MKRLECGADEDSQRTGQSRITQRQPEAGAHEADGDGEEMEVAQKPEGPLILDAPVALVLGHEVDRAAFDGHRVSSLFAAGERPPG